MNFLSTTQLLEFITYNKLQIVQKAFKLLENCEFNHLTNILTALISVLLKALSTLKRKGLLEPRRKAQVHA